MSNWINGQIKNEDIVLSSRVRLARNIENYNFPETISVEDGREIVLKVYNSLKNKEDKKYKLTKLWIEEGFVKEDIEKHLISKEILNDKDKSAYIINKDETATIMINEEDHIKIQSVVQGLNLKQAFDIVMKLDDEIEGDIDYAFHNQYGYLTSSLTNIGTGIRAGVMIHLPALALSQGITSILKGLNQVGMTIRGVYGENSSALGNIYLISNQISLGVSEEEIIRNLESVVENIIEEEKKCREKLFSNHRDEMEDKIYRAHGVLKNATLISMKECLELLSTVRMGVEMSILDIDKKKLNELLVLVTDEIIEKSVVDNNSGKANEKQRARIIKDILK